MNTFQFQLLDEKIGEREQNQGSQDRKLVGTPTELPTGAK